MKSAGKLGVERFAQGWLGDETKVTVPRSTLCTRGYDLEVLRELLADYRQLPTAERRFLIEGEVDSELHITRNAEGAGETLR